MSASGISRRVAVVTGALLLLAGGVAGYLIAHHSRNAPASAAAGSGERQILYWHDPMVPNARFDKPGKSPFMDMQLQPVYADEVAGEAGISVAANVTQSLGVRLSRVEKASLRPKLRAVGTVVFNEQLQEVVAARAEGVVTRLFVHAPFEPVRRGQALAQITSPAWVEAQQEYLSLLEAQSVAGRALRFAARERLRVIGIPEATIQQIETSRAVSASTTLVAPIDGVVSELGAREGAAIAPGMSLFRINGLQSVWLNARIPETQRALADVGSGAEAVAVAWPGEKFQGKVIAIQPQVEADSRTLIARILLQNTGQRLVPGMFLTADIAAAEQPPQLVVPEEAVISTGERSIVITADAQGRFGVATVTTGASQDGRTVVTEGLSEGQTVVVSGQFLIDSEASLKSTVARLQAFEAMPVLQAPPAAPVAHRADGSIKAISAETITIAHGPVTTLQWPGMTMGFKSPSGGLPVDLKVGDHVSFSFVESGSGYQLVVITKLEHGAGMEHER